MPRNDPHLMGSDLSLRPVPGREIVHPPKDGGLYSIHHGGNGERTQMVCGFLGCASAKDNPVISTLPPMLKFTVAEGAAGEWMRSTFRYAAEEVSAGRPGSETVLAKLSELLFVEAVRRYAKSLPDGQTGWLASLREPYVGRALALLHRDTTRRWTLDDLGREVGLSRSALADRFIRLVGIPPMHYLAHWRMQVATQKLRNTNRPSRRWRNRSATSPRRRSRAPSRRPSVRSRDVEAFERVGPRGLSALALAAFRLRSKSVPNPEVHPNSRLRPCDVADQVCSGGGMAVRCIIPIPRHRPLDAEVANGAVNLEAEQFHCPRLLVQR